MEGATISDLMDKAKKAGVRSIMMYIPAGAESIEELSSRAKAFFCEICKYMILCVEIISKRDIGKEESVWQTSAVQGTTKLQKKLFSAKNRLAAELSYLFKIPMLVLHGRVILRTM